MTRPILPADLSAIRRPLLSVVIDTEEEFDWGAPFASRNTQVAALSTLVEGQRLFRRHGVYPAYLVDYPICTAPAARDVFGPWIAAGECLIGTQLHPWVNPPFEEVVCPLNSFPCNLEPGLERRKLTLLTEAITAAFGKPPVIYKAGRYGMKLCREATLTDLGYLVDTSVVPNRSFAGSGGGPDFFGFPETPFWCGNAGGLLYLPSTHGVVGALRGLARGNRARLVFGRLATRLHLPGILARAGLVERIMLTPEGTTLAEMCRLVDCLVAEGTKVFTLSLHSPSLMPGGTPYATTAGDVAALLGRIDGFLEHFLGRLGGEATTPTGLRERILATAPPSRGSPPSRLP